ncbi:hypothetical protein RIF29_22919 [Crotalaria pallida]|uniref:Hyaluronan/mRNA-binding protein domain-containing protein n=1 Tax=Crotalaria pallida TaxID=3830 RepID=A0AAN9F5K2_CROPI
MASVNPFDLLGDEAEDHSPQLAAELLIKASAAPKKPSSNTIPPSQAVREARNDNSRVVRGADRGRGYGGRGRSGSNRDSFNDENSFTAPGGRNRGGFNRDSFNDENKYTAPAGQGAHEGEFRKPSEREEYGGPRGPYRGARGGRGGFGNGEAGEDGHSRRAFDRRSGTGRGNEFKREGAGKGNWGALTDDNVQVNEEVNEAVKNSGDEKSSGENVVADGKDSSANDAEVKPEVKEMTLEEYEKVLEEKRKAFQALKTEERKVDTKVFESMQQLSSKKNNADIFAKLGTDKDKRKEALEKEEKSKKSVSIDEFLKPLRGGNYYNAGGRGRDRGRGARGGGDGGNSSSNVPAPSIEDPGHFPTLGAK